MAAMDYAGDSTARDPSGRVRLRERKRRREGSATAALAPGRLELEPGLEDGERGPKEARRERRRCGSVPRPGQRRHDSAEALAMARTVVGVTARSCGRQGGDKGAEGMATVSTGAGYGCGKVMGRSED
ncbi:hypothetical protein E2562_031825 [Oryza meyeriana var. granulata]|uniref:Uncharacterized protein n=1 Tax=Oryza meyeriana var. granulata TaxID=110450 RepID=A0A6G1CVI4_9ORYZ|nr:hypothetical protein E2562_031825 [Oryza meyeriana var. granulata]